MPADLPAGGTDTVAATLHIPHPRRWGTEAPYLYAMVTEILRGSQVATGVENLLRWNQVPGRRFGQAGEVLLERGARLSVEASRRRRAFPEREGLGAEGTELVGEGAGMAGGQ